MKWFSVLSLLLLVSLTLVEEVRCEDVDEEDSDGDGINDDEDDDDDNDGIPDEGKRRAELFLSCLNQITCCFYVAKPRENANTSK